MTGNRHVRNTHTPYPRAVLTIHASFIRWWVVLLLSFLYFGQATAQSPGGVSSSLELWLRADVGVNGSPITSWEDQSTNNNDATRVGSSNVPTLATDQHNFNPSVYLSNGDNSYFSIDVSGTKGANYNLIVVIERDNSNGSSFLLGNDQSGGFVPGHKNLHFGYRDNTTMTLSHYSPLFTDYDVDVTVNAYNSPAQSVALLRGALNSSTGKSMYQLRDGSATSGSDGNTTAVAGSNNGRLGRGYDSRGFEGYISEVIITSSTLTATELQRIYSYLAIKYGFTLESSMNYLASNSSVVWNASTNSDYHNDVAGIGRDDGSALEQQKSLSESSDAMVTIDKGGSFDNDRDFILWGNNNEPTSLTTTDKHPDYDNRLEREWKVAVTGTPGAVTVEISYPSNTGVPSNYALHVDGDGTFGNTNDATSYPASSIDGNTITFENVSFTDGDHFTLGEVIQVPGGVSGTLEVWLKADAEVTSTAWEDQSGNGNDYTEVTGPTLVDDALNFNPAVEILSGGYDAPAGSELGTDWTLFFVSQKLASDNTGRLFDGHISNYLWAYHGVHRNGLYLNASPSEYNSGIASTTGIEDLHLFSYKRENTGGTLEARADGESLKTFGTSNSASGVRIDINQGFFSAGESSDARVGEMIVFNSTLSPTDVDKVESFLSIKYGLMKVGDYVASSGTTLWDATINGLYHNDVAGIGQDLVSDLDQQKSISASGDAMVIMDKGGSFANDLDFILWGNDDGAVSVNGVGSSTDYHNILQRTWKAAVSGSPGTVTVRMIYSNTGVHEDYALHVDGDGDFSDGNATSYVPSSISGDTLTFNNVTFSHNDFFTLGVNRAQSPGYVVDGLVLWMKANEGITGSPITSWADQSAYGNDATQAGASNFPTAVNNFHNFNPTVYFPEGEFGYFDVNLDQIKGTSYNLIAVVERSFPYNENYFLGIESMATLNEGLRFGYGMDTEVRLDQEGNGITAATLAYNSPSQTPALLRGALDIGAGKTISELRDGNSVSNTDAVTTTIGGTNSGRLGKGHGQYGFTGYVSELIAYNKTLDDTELRKIYSYLAIKYGLTLERTTGAEGDYLASDGTLLWDASANATYHNDIAGIGQDDDSGLFQQQSMSESADALVTMDNGGSFGEFDFILWGNNDGDISLTTTNKHPSYDRRMTREWKVAASGTPGLVDVHLVFDGVSDAITDYVLHVDGDGTFASGTTDYAVSSINGNTLTFENVAFADGDFFTLGINQKSPGNVNDDLILWLKADGGVSGTTAVTQWDDHSGNAHHTTATTGPAFTDNSLNFNPTLTFNGVDELMRTANEMPAITNEFSGYVVLRKSSADANKNFLSYQNVTWGQLWSYGTPAGDNSFTIYSQSSASWRWTLDGTAPVVTDPRILSADWITSGNLTYYANGTASGTHSETNAIADLPENSRVIVGARGSGGSEVSFDHYFDGDIAEVIYYSTSLSANDQRQVATYLAIKYGITLSHDYLASDGSTIWDATANSTYHNDVASIGRDDDSDLDQQKSMSVNEDALVIMDKGGSFGTNLDIILWGNDNGDIGLTSNDKHPSYDKRLAREWHVTTNGTPGAVDVRLLFTGVCDAITDYVLHVDDDGTFASGTTEYTVTSISGDTLTFENVTFANGDYFTLGINQISPGDVDANLVLWLKADVGVTGSSPVTSWVDQSGHGNDASNVNSPELNSGAINFNPGILFDESDEDYFTLDPSLLPGGNSGRSYFFVCESTASGIQPVFGHGSQSPYEKVDLSISDNELGIDVDGTRNGPTNHVAAPSIVQFTIGTGAFIDPGFEIHQNGLEVTPDFDNINGQTNILNTNSALAYVGRQLDNLEEFNGTISEIIVYDRDLSATPGDAEKVQTYLATKYGITLDNSAGGTVGDYVASDGSTIWDADDESSYHKDVVLIGRDDNSALHQKQSGTLDDSLHVYIDALAADNLSNTGSIATDLSFLMIGHNGERLMAHVPQEAPLVIRSRFNREWKVTNANFTDDFSMEIEWEEIGSFDINDIRLLVDDDGDFSNAAVFAHGDNGLTITNGSIIIGGISTLHVPINQTSYVTIGSVSLGTPLPIDLIRFDAIADPQAYAVDLSWSTASEYGNELFTIEKSRNSQDWVTALMVPGAGDSDERLDYDAIDTNPFPGISYYRLKQTDVDGDFSYSNTLHVTLGDFEDEMTLYPNPAQNQLTITGRPKQLQGLQVFNASGRDVTGLTRTLSSLGNELTLDISALPVGIFTIRAGDKGLKVIKTP